MKIEVSEVLRIAKLAHLRFDESELSHLARQLSGILTYMESLGRVDTQDVEPTFHPLGQGVPFREDLPMEGLSEEQATKAAPGGVAGKFVVPRIVG